jgi:hypothetical protein
VRSDKDLEAETGKPVENRPVWGRARSMPNKLGSIVKQTSEVLEQIIEIKNKELINSLEKQNKRNV